jgi:hypothetical protein
MSKDKGQKNNKKAPADKSSGKSKAVSSYKSEGKVTTGNIIEAFNPKAPLKSGANPKV